MSTTADPSVPAIIIGGRRVSIELTLTVVSFVLGLAAILGAWGSQLFGGLVPCELCLAQRQAYYWGLPVLAVILLLWTRLPRPVWYVAMAIAALIFVWSTEMGTYHAGVEWLWWKGPTACTGIGDTFSFDALKNLNAARVVPCDVVQWRDPILKLSLAGYNALLSLAIVVMLGCAIALRARKSRAA